MCVRCNELSCCVPWKLQIASYVATCPNTLHRRETLLLPPHAPSIHPCSCAPCHLGWAVGPFTMLATPRVLPQHLAAAAGGKNGQQKQRQQQQPVEQFTHFAPRRESLESAVASVLADQPAAAAAAGMQLAEGDGTHAYTIAGSTASGLSHSAHLFGLVAALYEEVLQARFPLATQQQVFLPPELLLRDSQAAVGLQLMSTAHLIQPRAIEQSSEDLGGRPGLLNK